MALFYSTVLRQCGVFPAWACAHPGSWFCFPVRLCSTPSQTRAASLHDLQFNVMSCLSMMTNLGQPSPPSGEAEWNTNRCKKVCCAIDAFHFLIEGRANLYLKYFMSLGKHDFSFVHVPFADFGRDFFLFGLEAALGKCLPSSWQGEA